MGNTEEKIIQFLKYEIDDFAYLEERRFRKSIGKRFIFIRKKYLISHHPESRSSIMGYRAVDTPLSLPEESRELFISLPELEKLITRKIYNLLLKELLTNAKGFGQTNIVFDHLYKYKDYETETINFIINLTLSNREIRKSFQAHERMPKLILNNIHKIESSLIQKYVSNFPPPSIAFFDKHKEEYTAMMDTIRKSIRDNTNIPKETRNSRNRSDWNLEIQAGEDELRKWDEEDPDWRIANDVG